MAAELAQIYHAAQHEHSYRSLDCRMKLNVFIFNDEICKISCGHTKYEAIVTEVLAPASVKEIINIINLNMLEGYANTSFLFCGK
jgi:hypothetical protein